jgi:putative transposase
VETLEPNLSEGMKWLQGTWVMRFNRYWGEVGRPFQGRYKALHVEPGHALAQVAHYIHLNPVRANITTADQLMDFRWSSLRLFSTKPRPVCLEAETLLRESGELSDNAAGWARYREYLSVLAEEDAKRREKRFGRLSRGWMIGSPQFKAELKQELLGIGGDRGSLELLGADHAAHREARESIWEEKLQVAAKALSLQLDQLPANKSAREKLMLAAVMKAATSVSNGWLAERLRMGRPSSVSQFVRRFRLAGGAGRRDFKIVLSKVMT